VGDRLHGLLKLEHEVRLKASRRDRCSHVAWNDRNDVDDALALSEATEI
jgi:hypothetical protein